MDVEGTMVVPMLSIVVRVAAVYVFLLVLVRMAGKREIGRLSPMEFLSALLLSETVSPALTGGDDSLAAAFVAALTLMLLTIGSNVLSYRYRWFEALSEGSPGLLISCGRVNRRVMKQERITDQQLATALRREGVESVEAVRKAFVEPNGDITILKAAAGDG
jgi:uncharacterized membrane protein YcaP (DUF421 family)